MLRLLLADAADVCCRVGFARVTVSFLPLKNDWSHVAMALSACIMSQQVANA